MPRPQPPVVVVPGITASSSAGSVESAGRKRVRKVATLGTPFKGSFEAALKMITGQAPRARGSQDER